MVPLCIINYKDYNLSLKLKPFKEMNYHYHQIQKWYEDYYKVGITYLLTPYPPLYKKALTGFL